jgi:hypothetical protein
MLLYVNAHKAAVLMFNSNLLLRRRRGNAEYSLESIICSSCLAEINEFRGMKLNATKTIDTNYPSNNEKCTPFQSLERII